MNTQIKSTAKVSNDQIEVIKVIPERELPPQRFSVEFLNIQKKSIQTQLDAYTAQRQAEIEEIDSLLAECTKLGVVAKEEKPVEEPINEIIK